ncbi:hypothetical protein SAMN05216554_2697 [Herbiconiux ginsengi]|uniref:Uncharacterized protein n=1 Tax=Herbiconiux ginsengi TaxID=381665 RepID=A0A1H3QQZ8_9MICO|nr:hypothetical protein SAMN05216554_2697 [Herbiconiux ginsengi]
MRADAFCEERAVGVLERLHDALDLAPRVGLALPICNLLHHNSKHHLRCSVIDKHEERVRLIELVRKSVWITEVTTIGRKKKVGLCGYCGRVDVKVVRISARELHTCVVVRLNLVEIIDQLVMEASRDRAIKLRLFPPDRPHNLDNDIDGRMDLEHVACFIAQQEQPIPGRSTVENVAIDKNSLKHALYSSRTLGAAGDVAKVADPVVSCSQHLE